MSFWNFIGLSSRKDIENVNKQLEKVKNTMQKIVSYENESIKKSISDGFENLDIKFTELNSEFCKRIYNLENKTVKGQELTNEELENINLNLLKSYDVFNKQLVETSESLVEIKTNKEDLINKINDMQEDNMKNKHLVYNLLEKISFDINKLSNDNVKSLGDLNTTISNILNEIKKVKDDTNTIETIINKNKDIKQIADNLLKAQKQLDVLNKDMSIIQQMIRVIWVNDIVDTLEGESSKIKIK